MTREELTETVMAELQRRLSPDGRRKSEHEDPYERHLSHVPQVECVDGLKMSVQASAYHYCSPRDSEGPWYNVEVGFPTREVAEIAGFAEDPSRPTDTVYGYVPLEKVAEAIVNAGGFAEVSADA